MLYDSFWNPYEIRENLSALRAISITPSGVSTRNVLGYTIPDMMKVLTDVYIGKDAEGISICIFFEVFGYMGYYPAAPEVIHVMEHKAWTPCPLRPYW